MTAEIMFNRYREMKKELALLEMQLNNATGLTEEDVIEGMTFTGQPDGDRVQTSNISDKTCSIALDFRKRLQKENEDYYRFLYDRYKELKEEVNFFEGGIRMLGGTRADIMFELLDGDLTWDLISEQYNVSRRTIANYRNSAIKELNLLYAQRERTEMAYMLS